MSTAGPIEKKYRAKMNDLARFLDLQFNVDLGKRTVGFALFIFPFNTVEGRINYISNTDRKEMLVAMKEFIARNEGMDPPKGGHA